MKKKNKAAQELGKKSWKARRKVQGSKYFSELAKKGWEKRRANLTTIS